MPQPPEYLRRAAGRDRIANITAVFRSAFPEVPEEVVRGHLEGREVMSPRRWSAVKRALRVLRWAAWSRGYRAVSAVSEFDERFAEEAVYSGRDSEASYPNLDMSRYFYD